MTPAASYAPRSAREGWLRRSEAWLDDKGKGAWIAAMVLGFIFFWPLGLALLFYMIWSKRMFNGSCARRTHRHHGEYRVDIRATRRSSGNAAFDAYKEETLRRLEDEQEEFESFLERLRAAKDKAEFDQFMDDRSRRATDAHDAGQDDAETDRKATA